MQIRNIVASLCLLALPAMAQTNLTTGTNNNGNNLVTMNCDLTGTASEYCWTFSESGASSVSGNPVGVVQIAPLSGSTLFPLNITQFLTGSQTLPGIQLTPQWNTSGNVLGAIFVNVTDTTSGSNSLVMNLERNSATILTADKNGNVTAGGALIGNTVQKTQTPPTYSCSTSGSLQVVEDETGYPKHVIAYLNACNGTYAYTFPTAFSHTPVCPTTTGLACTIMSSTSTTGTTFTGSTTTGFLVLEGW